jgi:CubicO group peptidase (beta-lactamase class C family)
MMQEYPYIDRALEQAIENGSTPGIALLAMKGQEIAYRKTFGHAQIYPKDRPLDADALFDIASLTKVIATTTASMQLVQEQKVSLDDSLQKFLPGFPYEQVTLLQILTHSAGFSDHLPLYDFVQEEAQNQGEDFIGSPDAKELVIRLVCQADLLYTPGKFSKYSDLGFILLGRAIEKICGVSLDRYCDEAIFRPFGMKNTFFQPVHGDKREGDFVATERCGWRRRVICGEVHDENAYAMGGVAGHAGLFSNLDDIQRFMTRLIACYQGQEETIRQDVVAEFFRRQNLVKDSTRALGWDTPSRNMKEKASGGTIIAETSVGHTGFTGTSIWFDPTREMTIILLANRIHPSRHNTTFLNMRPRIHDTVVIALDK